MILRQDDAAAARYIGNALGVIISPPFVGLVAEKNGAMMGAIVVNNYDLIGCDLTVAGKMWDVTVVRNVARYVFGTLRCKRASARTRASNAKAIRALERLGFKREGVIRNGFEDDDAILFGLLGSEQKLTRI